MTSTLIVQPSGSLLLKKQIWKLDILPKIQHFLWKVLSGALPTYVQLCSRGVNIDPICQRCCLEEETINHVLFLCPHAFAIWRYSGLSVRNLQSDDLESNILVLLDIMKSEEIENSLRRLPFWLMWIIWKSRNEFLFSHRKCSSYGRCFESPSCKSRMGGK